MVLPLYAGSVIYFGTFEKNYVLLSFCNCLIGYGVYPFTGLDYWTDIFLVFTLAVVGLIDPN